MMNLESKDIAVLTTGATELDQYISLKNYQVKKEISRGKRQVKFLIFQNSDVS